MSQIPQGFQQPHPSQQLSMNMAQMGPPGPQGQFRPPGPQGQMGPQGPPLHQGGVKKFKYNEFKFPFFFLSLVT